MKHLINALCAACLVALLALATPSAHAGQVDADLPGSVFNEGALKVTLTSEPCAPSVLQYLKPNFHALYRRANVVYEGKAFAACWAPFEDGTVFLVDETGDHGALEKRRFVKPPSA